MTQESRPSIGSKQTHYSFDATLLKYWFQNLLWFQHSHRSLQPYVLNCLITFGADFRLFRAHFDNSPCSLHVVILFFIEVIALFERELKRLNPTIQRIQYSIQDVFNYIDSLPEIAFLVYALSPSLSDPLSSNDNYNGYTLIPKEGIKKRVHEVFIQESTRQ